MTISSQQGTFKAIWLETDVDIGTFAIMWPLFGLDLVDDGPGSWQNADKVK